MGEQYRWRLKNYKADALYLTGCGLSLLLLPSPNPYMDIYKGKNNYRSTYNEEEFDALAQHYGLDKDDFEKVEVEGDLEELERELWSRTEFVEIHGKTCMILKGVPDAAIGSEESATEAD